MDVNYCISNISKGRSVEVEGSGLRRVDKTFISKQRDVSVQENKCAKDTAQNTMLPTQVISVVSDRPGVSDFINTEMRNVFYK